MAGLHTFFTSFAFSGPGYPHMLVEGQVDLSEHPVLAGGHAFSACLAEPGIQIYERRFILIEDRVMMTHFSSPIFFIHSRLAQRNGSRAVNNMITMHTPTSAHLHPRPLKRSSSAFQLSQVCRPIKIINRMAGATWCAWPLTGGTNIIWTPDSIVQIPVKVKPIVTNFLMLSSG